MEMQKSVILAKKNLKINIQKIGNIIKLVKYHCHYTEYYRGVAHSICSLGGNTEKYITFTVLIEK